MQLAVLTLLAYGHLTSCNETAQVAVQGLLQAHEHCHWL